MEDRKTIEHHADEKRPKYPRKLWFGLTDYGPPEFGLTGWISTAIFVIGMYIVKHY